MNGGSSDFGNGITVDTGGNVYATGYFDGGATFGGGKDASGNLINGSDITLSDPNSVA